MIKPRHTALLIITCAFLSACSIQPVQPWERDVLAQKKMELNSHPLDTYLDEHIYYSKENSSGGQGVGGGGCGCN
jgi:hypothetical protein